MQSGASGRSQPIVCQELCPPKGWRVGKGAEVPLGMPQSERGHVDRKSTLSSRGLVDKAVVYGLKTKKGMEGRKVGREGGK